MARAPFQILVYPYLQVGQNEFEYALLRRADAGFWQGVAGGGEIVLSHEHTTYRWLRYEQAHRLARYDGNKTALWELDRRLRGLGPRD